MTRVDGHAHFHANFSLETFLHGAREKLLRVDGKTGALLLAHIGSETPLHSLQERTDLPDAWTRTKPDATSLLFQHDDGTSIVIVAGRQIATAEKLELLTLCSDASMQEGLSLRESIQMALSNSAIPVVPWGFGKWWFSRGKLLKDLIQSDFEGHWLIGDSGCRIAGLPPKMLALANQAGIATIAGSDPLPIASHAARAGSYGTVFPETMDLNQPTVWMRNALQNLDSAPSFGRCRSLPQFVCDQLGLRIAKRSSNA